MPTWNFPGSFRPRLDLMDRRLAGFLPVDCAEVALTVLKTGRGANGGRQDVLASTGEALKARRS
jgi:hypothetical protein